MRANLSALVIGVYAVLLILIVVVIGGHSSVGFTWVTYLLVAVTLLFLAQYVSTSYAINDTTLIARTVLGSKRIPLEQVRSIEYASLRTLAPTGGGLVGWIWRGRLYHPDVGEFDTVFTDAASGLLVTGGKYPIYISPREPREFARELSRRARSYSGQLLKDVGYTPSLPAIPVPPPSGPSEASSAEK